MIQKKYLLCSLSLFLLFVTTRATQTGYLPGENHCYDPQVRTIQIYKDGFELSAPIFQLQSAEGIAIHFDDFNEYLRRWKFTFVHYTADWSAPSDLSVIDYIDGYREEEFNGYKYSYNTTARYTHFSGRFPTQTMRPKISGNYLLIVYEEDAMHPAFTARFVVFELSPLTIGGQVNRSADGLKRNSHQQLDFIVGLNGIQVYDVEREIRVAILQNGRTDNIMMVSKPRFARTGELDYRYDDAIAFSGGNQFRHFDFKSLKYNSERIARIAYDTAYQVFLVADPARNSKPYIYDEDLNGRFYIKNDDNADDSNTEADYAWVHFYIPFPGLLTTGTVHILGELTLWQLDESSRLYYNPEHKGYEINLYLKQGYYNYMYVFREKGQTAGTEAVFEGAHYETENDYAILVYYRPAGSLYDRLMGVEYLNTLRR